MFLYKELYYIILYQFTTSLITGAVMTPIAGKLSDIWQKEDFAYYNDILYCWSFYCRIFNKHRLYADC